MRSVNSERARKTGRGREARSAPRVARTKQSARAGTSRRIIVHEPLLARLAGHARSWLETKRPMLLLSLALAGLVFIAALFAGGYVHRAVRGTDRVASAVADGAGFGIHSIHISGNVRVPATTLAAALGLERGQSIFNADLRAARARLMALDWVADAQVTRRYPDAIDVRIVEKHPFALWQSQKGLFVIERSGAVITARDVSRFAKLPKLAGAGGNLGADVVDAVAAHRALSARVVIVERIGERRWNLILDDGVTVKLPEKDWQKQLDTLDHLIIDKGVLERDISEIDLRSPTHYFFVLKTAPKKDDGGKQI